MRDFRSIDAFVAFLTTLPEACRLAEHVGVEAAGEIVQAEAKSLIGQENVQAGDHVWPDLAVLTVLEKRRLGYVNQVSPTDPLLRTGHLRDSIGMEAQGNEAVVGSNDLIAEYQEFGTDRIPARSFLGAAAFRKTDWAVDAMTSHVAHALAGSPKSNRAPDARMFDDM